MAVNIPSLAHSVGPSEARRWVREVVASIGPGFHFETPPADYRSAEGRAVLSGVSARRLADGLERARRTLGSNRFESLCLETVWAVMGYRYDRRLDLLVALAR